MTKKSTLLKKLSSYSALASVVVAAAQKADGQIVYHLLNPYDTLHVRGIDSLDLNGDGTHDFVLGIGRETSITNGAYNIPFCYALNGNDVERDAAFSGSTLYAQPNSLNALIIGSDSWVAGPRLDVVGVKTKKTKGLFAGKGDKYVGLRVLKSGLDYYGWVRVNLSALADTMIIKDYAYNTKADSSIKAGQGQTTGIAPVTNAAAVLESLNPNPAMATANIIYTIYVPGSVTLELYDITGRKIKTLLNNAQQTPGRNRIPADVSGLSSGVYFYKLTVNGQTYTQKLVVAH